MTRFGKGFMARVAALLRDTKGASAVEFALVFPLAFVLIMGTFEFGLLMFNNAAVEGAVREAARYGLVGNGTTAEREAAIAALIDQHTYGLVEPADITITTEVYPSFGGVDQGEPFTDSNGDGEYTLGEPFVNLTTDDAMAPVWDADIGQAGVGKNSEIVQYTVEYDWNMIVLPFVTNLPMFPSGPVISDGVVRMKASMTVRNEPFKPS
jgi:Flp pilus assembly pilin Flp